MSRKFLSAAVMAAGLGALSANAYAETPLERGRYLVNSIVACGNCHTPKTAKGLPDNAREFAGFKVVDEKPMTAWAPNITQHKKDGIGAWTDAQIIKAIRDGVRPDGSLIGPPMPFHFYREISDTDVKAMVAYLRTVKPVAGKTPKSAYRIPLPPNWGAPVKSVPDVPRTDKVKYGEYLVGSLGHCTECHTPMVKGKRQFKTRLGAGGFAFHGPWGVSVSANITSHKDGIKAYSDADIEKAIRTGKRPDGSPLLPPMAYPYYKNISKPDMSAIIAYLRTLPPKPTQ